VFVVLVTQHAKCMRRTILLSVLYHILSYFLVNGTIFGRSVIEYNICGLISLQLVSEAFLTLRRTERVINI